MEKKIDIPGYVQEITEKLEKAGFAAHIVGGCVRDLLLSKTVKDWDITTNARPEEILKVFVLGKYENKFGTVLVPIKNKEGKTEDVVEITTYRSEQGYSDRRHPDEVRFEDSLDKDLERRDFTINAMAIQISDFRFQISDLRDAIVQHKVEIVDLFGGRKDLEKKIIRAVGEPVDRLKEDALRMMRAIRFSCQLGFSIEPKTERAIKKMAGGIKFISQERIRDELVKILETEKSYEGIMFLHNNKLLQYILPELERGVGVDQNRHHIYTVFNHSVLSLKYCPNKDWRVKFASLLHDIAKPQAKRFIGGDATFYNHDIIGAKIAKKIMQRLKFSNEDLEKVTNLIRHHMFYYNVGEVTEASVRRLIKKAGEENLADLIDLRVADRLGSGVPKAKPYKLRHLEYMMEKVRKDPICAKMLKINGDDLMKFLKITPGPKIGAILDVLLSEVIEDPKLNDKKYLEKRSKELNEMELDELRKKAKGRIEEKKMEDDKELKGEFWVK
ncbi:MAG: HD domain-containing protein [Patescibacteria group bacterium]